MLCSTHDPRLCYFSRGMNYVRSRSVEALRTLQRSTDESERRRILNDLQELARVRGNLEHDPAGNWRFEAFKSGYWFSRYSFSLSRYFL